MFNKRFIFLEMEVMKMTSIKMVINKK